MRGNPAVRSLNLLPWRDQRQRIRRRDACVALLCGLVGGTGVIAGTELHFAGKLHQAERRSSQLQAAIAGHGEAAAKQRELMARSTEMGAVLAELQRVRRRNRAVRDWLEQLPGAVPPELRLKRLAIKETAWELQGMARSLEPAARLLQTVRAMPMVSEARIEHVRGGSIQTREFVLVGWFRE